MTREQWKERLPIIQVFCEGKIVQGRGSFGDWNDLINLKLDGPIKYYRIKPDPRRWWLLFDAVNNKFMGQFDNLESANLFAVQFNCNLVPVVEELK